MKSPVLTLDAWRSDNRVGDQLAAAARGAAPPPSIEFIIRVVAIRTTSA